MVKTGTSLSATKDEEHPGYRTIASPRSDSWSQLIPVATVLGFAIPAVSYLWMIHTYGANIIFVDQWDDVALIGHAFSGTLHFSTLWSQHYENRILFPNLIVLALGYTTHLNVVTEEYLSALMLFGGTTLVICAHKRRSPVRRWIWYCPVAFLMLSLAQAGNALWGFQLAWYLVLLMVALALFLLDQEPQSWLVFGGAIAAAAVASFSSLEGLLVWPAGLLLIYLRGRPGHLVVAWIGSAVVAGALYFVGFNFNASDTHRTNPTSVFTFFLRVVGDIVGATQPGVLVTFFGSVLVVTAIWSLIRFVVREQTTTGGRPFALSLVLFGLLFAGLTAFGRSGPGYSGEYRFTVFASFVLVGLYLAVLDPSRASKLPSSEPESLARRTRGHRPAFFDPLFALARAVVGIGILVTVIVGSANGIAQARVMHENQLDVARLTVRANQYSDLTVEALYLWQESAQSIRHQIAIARDDRLSLFGTGDAARYRNENPPPLSPLRAVVALPRNGSTVHGKQFLDVVGSDSYDVTKVEYFLNGPGSARALFATGTKTKYGWIALWNTSTVSNGSYTIDAIVSDSGGRSVRTHPVEVLVDNMNPPGS